MAGFKLSNKAIADLERLYQYGVERFGFEKADRYYDGLVNRFEDIARNPPLAPMVEHIHPGLRRLVYHSHSIYFSTTTNGIYILRVLGRESVARALM